MRRFSHRIVTTYYHSDRSDWPKNTLPIDAYWRRSTPSPRIYCTLMWHPDQGGGILAAPLLILDRCMLHYIWWSRRSAMKPFDFNVVSCHLTGEPCLSTAGACKGNNDSWSSSDVFEPKMMEFGQAKDSCCTRRAKMDEHVSRRRRGAACFDQTHAKCVLI